MSRLENNAISALPIAPRQRQRAGRIVNPPGAAMASSMVQKFATMGIYGQVMAVLAIALRKKPAGTATRILPLAKRATTVTSRMMIPVVTIAEFQAAAMGA